MRNFTLILLLLLITLVPGYAQEFNFGGFASIPIGKYGSQNIDDGGFARTGWGVSFEALARGKKWPGGLGLGFNFSYQVNEIDAPALARAYNEILGLPLRAAISNTSYRPLTATIGPNYRFDFGERMHLDVKTGFGIMLSNIDPLTITFYDGQQNPTLVEEVFFQSEAVFTYLVGVNFGYDFTDFLGLRVFVNHSSANERYSTAGEADSKQSINYINPGLALSLLF